MEDNLDILKRKRRKLGHANESVEEATQASAPKSRLPTYDFLNLASLILEHDIAILWPGTERPRNAYALLGAGSSFLVFKEERKMDELTIRPDQLRSLENSIVLKRTRRHQEGLYPHINNNASRYMSIMAELQILLDPAVQAHENIIDLQGLTWDFEPEDDGSYSVWPVIGLEAAESSMQSLMYEYDESDAPLSTRIQYCYNVAEALKFLHERGVVHCDVKLENVLICVTQRSGSVAKLSDFGSALLGVDSDTSVPKGVAGTPPWNAPEYRKSLQGLKIFKVDVFSYGMLVWRFLSNSPTLQRLDSGGSKALMQKLEKLKSTGGLASMAAEEVKERYDASDELDSVVSVLTRTLAPLPEDRCGMIDVSLLLEQWIELQDGSDDSAEYVSDVQVDTESIAPQGVRALDRDTESDEDIHPILPIQSEPFYNDFEKFYEVFEDESPLVKEQLINSLKACAGREKESASVAAFAAYQLSMCYVNAFGVPKDLKQAWKWMMKSAQLENPIARSQAFRLHRVLFPDQHLPPETNQQMTKWLQDAILCGSSEVTRDLLGVDPSLCAKAIRSWEKRYCEINLDGIPQPRSLANIKDIRQRLSGSDLEFLNERGSMPIHIAASFGDIDWLIELLGHGININERNAKGETPLLCACRANEPQAALFLLEHGASTSPAASGESPLHWLIAIDGSYAKETAKKLIERGADIEQIYLQTEENDLTFDVYPLGTPLDWAVSKRCLMAVGILTELGGNPFNESSQYSAFTRAASAHDWDTLQILLTSKHATSSRVSALESTGQSLLFEAIHCYPPYERLLRHGRDIDQAAIKTIKLLLEAGCDPSRVDKDGSSVMHILAGFCDYDFIKTLLGEFDFRKFINASAGDLVRTPIHQALAARKLDVFKLLIEYGADTYVRVRGWTLLHFLAANEEENYSILCLDALKPRSRNDLEAFAPSEDFPGGLTAFELAVVSSHLKFADLLLEAGADPAPGKQRDRHFLTLLVTLPSWNSFSALQYYLHKVEAPFILRQSTSLSILHVAASMMQFLADSITGEQKFNVLLNRYPSQLHVNARTTSSDGPDVAAGQTPLHYAAKFGVYYAVKMLLRAGADPSLRDHDGETPLSLARKQLALLAERIMEHEMIRVVSDLKSTVSLLEKSLDASHTTATEDNITEMQVQTRFSRLGFQTQNI